MSTQTVNLFVTKIIYLSFYCRNFTETTSLSVRICFHWTSWKFTGKCFVQIGSNFFFLGNFHNQVKFISYRHQQCFQNSCPKLFLIFETCRQKGHIGILHHKFTCHAVNFKQLLELLFYFFSREEWCLLPLWPGPLQVSPQCFSRWRNALWSDTKTHPRQLS